MAASLLWSNDKHGFLAANKACLDVLGLQNHSEVENEAVWIECGNKKLFFTLNISRKFWLDPIPTVCLNSVICEANGLPDEAEVHLDRVRFEIPLLSRIVVDPWQEEDWDILESNQLLIQQGMLSQIRIVQNGSPLVIFCHNVPIRLRLVQLDPEVSLGQIREGCEIAISPKEWQRLPAHLPNWNRGHQVSVCFKKQHQEGFVYSVLNFFKGKDSLEQCSRDATPVELGSKLFRLIPLDSDCHCCSFTFSQNPELVGTIVRLKLQIVSVLHDDEAAAEQKILAIPYVRILELPAEAQAQQQKLLLKNTLFLRLKCIAKLGDRAKIIGAALQQQSDCPELHHDKQLSHKSCHNFLSSDDIWPSLKESAEVDLECSSGSSGEPVIFQVVGDILQLLRRGSSIGKQSNLILVGDSGSGKSTVLQQLNQLLKLVYCHQISCKQLIGKRAEAVKTLLMDAITECRYRAPSLLLVDDLDTLCCIPQDMAAANPEQNHLASLASTFCRVLLQGECQTECPGVIGLVATVSHREKVHPMLLPGRGCHYMHQVLHLPPSPDVELRSKLFESFLICPELKESHQKMSASKFARLTEGFSPRDLRKAATEMEVKFLSSQGKGGALKHARSSGYFESLLSQSRPSTLWGVELQRKGISKGWNDVGGLNEVRRSLLETLQWPAKFPQVFSKCPLRLRSGILLYGPPGTGKTLVANAAALECDLNVITIKGPELLSKFIGESEAAVRKTFEKAQAAKPCILFFDEFDSLAPRRGHDSTGVTDRVVNQLLTQLDGVEGLSQGIFVIAATSRPDLVDPALLRPGRIDKILLCPMPDEADRLSILKALGKERLMAKISQGDLEVIAKRTQGFTGADLQALLYTAQLRRIHCANKSMDLHSSKKTATEASEGPRMELGQENKLVVALSKGEKACSSSKHGGGGLKDRTMTPATNGNKNNKSFSTTLTKAILDPKTKEWSWIPATSHGKQPCSNQLNLSYCGKIAEKEEGDDAITMEDLLYSLQETRPSVSGEEQEKYKRIYQQFSGDRAQVNVAAGTRSTLA